MDRAFEVSEGIAKEIYNKGYKKGRADREKEILDALKVLINGDYSSKECKLLYSDLLEFIGVNWNKSN